MLALDLITAGVLYDAIFSEGPGLSSNATQILTAAFGGIIGILGGYIGYRAGATANGNTAPAPAPPHTAAPEPPLVAHEHPQPDNPEPHNA